MAAGVFPAAASAQVAASINLDTDYRFRGYSLSAGRPTATAQLAFDHDSGWYLNGTVTGVAGQEKVALLGALANLGFARRLSSAISVDAGLIRSEYRRTYSGGRPAHYTEGYVGVTLRQVTARISYSPHYFEQDLATLYGELDAGIQPAPNWRLNAHVGALVYLREPVHYYGARSTQYDWRLGAARQFGRFEARAALSGGGPAADYYGGRRRDRTAVTAGGSWSF